MMEPRLTIIQTLAPKPVYHISELYGLMGSRATAYRAVEALQRVGFAQHAKRGYFTFRSSIFQPYRVWPHLLASLSAIRQARYFGRTYDENDVNYVRRAVRGIETLDYRAYELTGFQTPRTLFVYVRDPEETAAVLKRRGFSEGTRGRVAIMPIDAGAVADIQRVYLDCLAFGGRSTLYAVAIELMHGDQLEVKGAFPTELVDKVREDLPSGPRQDRG